MHFTWDIIIILLLFGTLFGVLSIAAGTGGGAFYVSFFTIFLLLPINISIDTSNFIILFPSALGFIIYLKDKRTNLKISLFYGGFSILGSLLCTVMLLFIELNNLILRLLFASLLIIVGLTMVYKSFKLRKVSNENSKFYDVNDFFLKDFDYKANLTSRIPLFLFAGFVSNLLGIGGGVVITPVLNLFIGFPIHFATGVSISIVFLTAIINSISKLLIGQVELLLGIIIAIGSIIGAIIGAKISKKLPKFYLQLFVAAILIGFAIRMYFQ